MTIKMMPTILILTNTITNLEKSFNYEAAISPGNEMILPICDYEM